MRTVHPLMKPLAIGSELTLKLARKCVDVIGSSAMEEEASPRPLNTGCDEETASVAVGKEFSLVRTVSGRVSSLGLSVHWPNCNTNVGFEMC